MLFILLLPLITSSQNIDSLNYVFKHKNPTISALVLTTNKSISSENPQYQFGIVLKNVIRGGMGFYLHGNKSKFIDDFSTEFKTLESRRGTMITESQYQMDYKNLKEKQQKGATLNYLNIGINHNFYNNSKIPISINFGINFVKYGGSFSSSLKGSVNPNLGINVFIPSKSRFEIGFVTDFTYYKIKKLKYYAGISLGLKI